MMSISDEMQSVLMRLRELAYSIRELECLDRRMYDKPEDRMWQAQDNTWWKRVNQHWEAADHPPGWYHAGLDRIKIHEMLDELLNNELDD